MDTWMGLDSGWYPVRCVFELDAAQHEHGEPHLYEERITLWPAASGTEAIAQAEEEAREYAESIDASYLGLAQCSKADVPRWGPRCTRWCATATSILTTTWIGSSTLVGNGSIRSRRARSPSRPPRR
jgi:hypothetical protein